MFSQSNNVSGGSRTNNNVTHLTDKYTSGMGSIDNDYPLKAYVTTLQNRNEGKGNNVTYNYCNVIIC